MDNFHTRVQYELQLNYFFQINLDYWRLKYRSRQYITVPRFKDSPLSYIESWCLLQAFTKRCIIDVELKFRGALRLKGLEGYHQERLVIEGRLVACEGMRVARSCGEMSRQFVVGWLLAITYSAKLCIANGLR